MSTSYLNKRTKIVATLGPASTDKEILREMILSGVNVCRINFSHGTHEGHLKTIQTIKELIKDMPFHVAILADLQGPKIRVGKIKNDNLDLAIDDEIIFTSIPCEGTKEGVYISYSNFAQDVSPGERILLDDGKITLEILEVIQKEKVVAKVIHGGILKSNKGVNLPNTKISLPCITDKDRKDLEFILTQDISWIGLSFVRSARDIIELRHLVSKAKNKAKIVAKIEKPEAVADIDDIIAKSDALMVARGDLGVEIPLQEVPLVQKSIVKKCLTAAKPVIIATQMMESMMSHATPSRAEVNDVANAVLDGADAVMLSGETSVGKFPIKVVETMSKIICNVEKHEDLYHNHLLPNLSNSDRLITDAICHDACELSKRVGAKAIVSMTFSGYTGFKLASFRPKANIFVFTSNQEILNMLSLIWGVRGFYYDKFVSTDHTIADIKYILKKANHVNSGDFVVNIASMPITDKGQSNMVKLSNVE